MADDIDPHIIAACQDFDTFCWYILGIHTWEKQSELGQAVMGGEWERIAVKACNSSSKSMSLAALTLFWLVYWNNIIGEPGSAINTSSSWPQVKKVLWHGESGIHNLVGRAAQNGVNFPTPNDTELNLPNGAYAMGLSTNDYTNFHGFHGRHVLFLKDESTGIDPDIHDAINSVAAGGHIVQVDACNPVTTSGPVNDLFEMPDSMVKKITIDAFKSPNFAIEWDATGENPDPGQNWHPTRYLTVEEFIEEAEKDDSPGGFLDWHAPDFRSGIACTHCKRYERKQIMANYGGPPVVGCRNYLTTRRWVWGVIKRYGVDSAYFESRVRGQFPSEGTDILIPTKYQDAALATPPQGLTSKTIQCGLDVAGEGSDETVLTARSGAVCLGQWGWSGLDSTTTINKVLAQLEALDPNRSRITNINVDVVMIGHHMAGALGSHGYPVTPVRVGEPAWIGWQRMYANLKAQLYWGLRMLYEDSYTAANYPEKHIEPGIAFVPGGYLDTLTHQISTLKYFENERGQGMMETKKQMRDRGVESPDYAESLMLAFAESLARAGARDFTQRLGYGEQVTEGGIVIPGGTGVLPSMDALINGTVMRGRPAGARPSTWKERNSFAQRNRRDIGGRIDV